MLTRCSIGLDTMLHLCVLASTVFFALQPAGDLSYALAVLALQGCRALGRSAL